MEGIKYVIDEFSVENFRSIFKKQTIVFDSNIKAFYGANSSGKTNIYNAMSAFRQFIIHSADPSSHGTPYTPFLLLEGASDVPSVFGIKFHGGEEFYEYSFSIDRDGVKEEEMYDLSSSRPRLIFKRSVGSTEGATRNGFHKKLFDGDGAVRNDSLLITLAHSTKNKYANAVFKAVRSINYVNLSRIDMFRESAVVALQRKPELYGQLIKLFKDTDFSINGISYSISKFTPESLAGVPLPEEVKKQLIDNGHNTIINTVHSVRNRDGDRVDTVMFDMNSQESLGTNNFFVLAVIMLDIINEGETLYVDEFRASTHTELCRFIVEFFKKASVKTGARLIINTHDIGLIKNGSIGVLDKNEIMIVEKDLLDETIVSPLKEKMRRNDENIGKKYVLGVYGGVPILEEVNNG